MITPTSTIVEGVIDHERGTIDLITEEIVGSMELPSFFTLSGVAIENSRTNEPQLRDVSVNTYEELNLPKFNVYSSDSSIVKEYAVLINGVNSISEKGFKGLSIYPNPASEIINLDWDGSKANLEVTIYNYEGRVVHESNETRVNIQGLTSGVYFIQVKEADKKTFVSKFIKE